MKGRLVLVVLAAAAAVTAAWFGRREAPPITNVVLITLDTTRADRLSPYGFADISLPTLERLAREGVVFDEAASVAPLTLPAHASLFTGLLPQRHGVRDNADPALAAGQTTLAEILRERGFKTAAFVGASVLDRGRGLEQGFDHYSGLTATGVLDPDRRQRRGDEVVNEAIAWLDAHGGSPFMMWTHLYDPHRPYDPPEPFLSKYAHDPYLGEIAFTDAQIGRLIEALEQRGLLDRTMVIVTADHGESLGAHGERDHGIFIYEEVVRVPLIIRAPGVAPGTVVSVVRLTDLMPTVLEALGIPIPSINGASLMSVIKSRNKAPDREAYAESLYPRRFGWSPLRSLRAGGFKLIQAPRPELYDLESDPFELENVYATKPDVARALTDRLDAIEKDQRDASAAVAATAASPALRAQLASLGYVSGPSRPAATSTPPSQLPDPKDCLGATGTPPAGPMASCKLP